MKGFRAFHQRIVNDCNGKGCAERTSGYRERSADRLIVVISLGCAIACGKVNQCCGIGIDMIELNSKCEVACAFRTVQDCIKQAYARHKRGQRERLATVVCRVEIVCPAANRCVKVEKAILRQLRADNASHSDQSRRTRRKVGCLPDCGGVAALRKRNASRGDELIAQYRRQRCSDQGLAAAGDACVADNQRIGQRLTGAQNCLRRDCMIKTEIALKIAELQHTLQDAVAHVGGGQGFKGKSPIAAAIGTRILIDHRVSRAARKGKSCAFG